ncbi:CYC2-like cyclin, putative [Bodo saltans]|uniref:CYC2-like cyclin, putative n=1 Tax=Bodo saltans TaxID=75058 RepID=A0A0S4IVQ9_BODSA|nr:CYC2-like cyclin, putative [Bodo saltans]|eukprot:CUF16635.1 CYC2-like cyclin, putative [Bodo saltans]
MTSVYSPPDAAMTEGVIDFLEQLSAANTTSNSVRSPFHSTHTPPMTIRLYCERIVKYSKCTPEAFVVGMLLLCKFTVFSGHPITVFNVHRMLITSTLIAAKMRDDEYYANTYYARIGGITADELNALEVHFLTTLSWDMWIGEDEFECSVAMLLTVRDAVVSGAPSLAQEVWTNWLQTYEQQTTARHSRVTKILAQDMEKEAAFARSPLTPGSPDEFVAVRRRGQQVMSSAAYRARGSRGSVQTQDGSVFPNAPSQQSLGHCESTTSVDAKLIAQGQNDSSRDTSGSLGPTEQSPRELGTFGAAPPSKSSWANVVARSSTAGTETYVSPHTPTSQNDSGHSSQQATPTRIMARQRFNGTTSANNTNNNSAKNTPTSIRRHLDPLQSSRPQAPMIHNGSAPTVSLAPTPDVSAANTPSKGGNKKRPKPEHYQDYR